MLTWFFRLGEFLIDNTPVVGKLKSAMEREYRDRELSNEEARSCRMDW